MSECICVYVCIIHLRGRGERETERETDREKKRQCTAVPTCKSIISHIHAHQAWHVPSKQIMWNTSLKHIIVQVYSMQRCEVAEGHWNLAFQHIVVQIKLYQVV